MPQVYAVEVSDRLPEYRKLAAMGGNGVEETDLLANAAHHLAHALSTSENVRDRIAAEGLRIEVFNVLYRNLNNKRAENERYEAVHGKPLPDWPELLKKVAVSGQHLLSLGSDEERMTVASVVMTLLDELVQICHSAQKPAVLLMVAHIHSQVGLIHIDARRVPAAHERFLLSYDISLALAAKSGEHVLEDSMSMLANTYAMQGQYDRALPLYQVS